MKFPAKASADFTIAPAGNHVAICNAVIDLGMQKGTAMYPDPKHQVYLRFELPNEPLTYTKDGKEISGPMSIGRRFTASMSTKANLRKFVESWFGKAFASDESAADFDLSKLLGYKCLLNVTHTEKGDRTYANVSNATPIPKGMAVDFAQHNPSLYFDLEHPDETAFHSLPEWLQKVVNERVEPIKPPAKTNGIATEDPNDDIPF